MSNQDWIKNDRKNGLISIVTNLAIGDCVKIRANADFYRAQGNGSKEGFTNRGIYENFVGYVVGLDLFNVVISLSDPSNRFHGSSNDIKVKQQKVELYAGQILMYKKIG
jgi:hypothetical protein